MDGGGEHVQSPRFGLADTQIHMLREIRRNTEYVIKLAKPGQNKLEDRYFKKFGREEPGVVIPVEEFSAQATVKNALKAEARGAPKAKCEAGTQTVEFASPSSPEKDERVTSIQAS